MEQTGVVMELDGDNAIVQFTRSKACENCGGCMTIGDGTQAIIVLRNTLCAQVGDHVRVELHAKRFVQANLIMYGIPLLMLLLGIALGAQISDAWGAICGLAGVALSYLGLRLLEPRFARGGKFQPRMLAIITGEPI